VPGVRGVVYSKPATTEGEYQKLPTVEMSSRQNEKAKQTFRLGAQMGGVEPAGLGPCPLLPGSQTGLGSSLRGSFTPLDSWVTSSWLRAPGLIGTARHQLSTSVLGN